MDGERGGGDGRAQPATTDRRLTAVFNNVSRQVQFLLDHNRLLINEINQNHEAKIPEGLTRNVTLIRQLNCNIAKVVDLYGNLSSNFSNVFENLQEVNSDQAAAAPVAAPSSGQPKKLRSAADFS